MSNFALPVEPITLNYIKVPCPNHARTVKFKEYPKVEMYFCEGQFGLNAPRIHINAGFPDIELVHVMQWGNTVISFAENNHVYLTAEKFSAGDGYAEVLTLIDANLSMAVEE